MRLTLAVGASLTALFVSPISEDPAICSGLRPAALLAAVPGDRQVSVAPPVMFWSWQHEDDLSTVDKNNVGVCYFVGRIIVDSTRPPGSTLLFERSLSHLSAPPGVYREAALRVEVKRLAPDSAAETVDSLASMILREALKSPARIDSLQIDFDAGLDQRAFYRNLLGKVRSRLPQNVHLTMTALASWCLGDNWLERANLPVDMVVPMFFSMGPGGEGIKTQLGEGGVSAAALAGRIAPGFSLNEPALISAIAPRLHDFKTVYLFSTTGWNKLRVEKVKKLIERNI